MSVLETLYTVIKLDSSDVQKGTKAAKKSTEDLNVSFKAANTVTHGLEQQFRDIAGVLKDTALTVLSIGGIIEGVKFATEYANNLYNTSQALNTNAQSLALFGDAVTSTGGSLNSFIGVASRLTDSLSEMQLRGTSSLSPLFVQLGIRVRKANGDVKTFTELMPELADSFQRLGKLRSRALGKELGFDEPTILLLQKGRTEIEKIIARQKELGVATDHQLKTAHEFTYEWSNTGHALRQLSLILGEQFLPILSQILIGFDNFVITLQQHGPLVISTIKGIGIAIATYFLPELLALAIAAAPVIAITAGIAALGFAIGIAIDDIQHYESGQESLLGIILKKYPQAAKAVNNFNQYFKQQTDETVKGFERIESIVNKTIAAIRYFWNLLSSIDNKFNSAEEKVHNFVHKYIWDIPTNTMQALNSTLNMAAGNPLAALTSTSITNMTKNQNRNSTVNMGDISINTQATSAHQVSKSLGDHLTEQMKFVVSNFDDAVMS